MPECDDDIELERRTYVAARTAFLATGMGKRAAMKAAVDVVMAPKLEAMRRFIAAEKQAGS